MEENVTAAWKVLGVEGPWHQSRVIKALPSVCSHPSWMEQVGHCGLVLILNS